MLATLFQICYGCRIQFMFLPARCKFWPMVLGLFLGGLLLAETNASGTSGVIISEFLARNQNTNADQDGDSSDWIEIYNSTDASVNLEGWYLTIDPARPTLWKFPRTTLAAKGY